VEVDELLFQGIMNKDQQSTITNIAVQDRNCTSVHTLSFFRF
jgi:hypothetical protein